MKQVHVPFLVMTLPILLPLATMMVDVPTQVKVTPLQHGNLFKKLGLVYVGSAYGHLVVPIRLSTLRNHRHQLDLINKNVQHLDENTRNPYTNKSILSKTAQKKIQWMKYWTNETVTNCLVKLDDALASFQENTTMIEGGRGRRAVEVQVPFRTKRQLIVGTIGAALGAGIAGIISKYQQDKLVKIMQKKQEVIIAQLEEDEVAIHQNMADVHRLNHTVGQLINAIYRLSEFANTTNYVQMTLTTTYSVTETTKTIDRVLDALESARSGSFNTNLGSNQALKKALNSLQQQGIHDGRVLGITSIMDLNHVESSYLVDFDEDVVYTIAHVQMPNPQSYLTLYSYQGSPIAIHPDSHIYAEVDYKGYLALAQDNADYQEWSEESLRQCKKFQNTWFCPETVRYQRKRKSCLTGLYDSDSKTVHEMCPINLVHSVSSVHQLNETAYVVTETDPQTMTITCKNYKTKVPIHGTVILQLKPTCVASTENLVITQPKVVAEVTVESKLITTPIELSIPPDEVQEFLDSAENLIGEVGQKVSWKLVKSLTNFKKKIQEANQWSFVQWISSLRPGSLLGTIGTWVVLAIFSLLVIKCGIWAWQRSRNRPYQRSRGSDHEYCMPGLHCQHLQDMVPATVAEPTNVESLGAFNRNMQERVSFHRASEKVVVDHNREKIKPADLLEALKIHDTGVTPEVYLTVSPPPIVSAETGLPTNTNPEAGIEVPDDIKLFLKNPNKTLRPFSDLRQPKEMLTQLSRSGWRLEDLPEPKEASPEPETDSGLGDPDPLLIPKNFVQIIAGDENPPDYNNVELEALTTFPFTSVLENCPKDPISGKRDPNQVAKFLKKRRQIRQAYFQKATPSEKLAMEAKEFKKYREYQNGSIHGGPGATDAEWAELRHDW